MENPAAELRRVAQLIYGAGMTCGSCANRVQRTLGKQPGVAVAEVNFATATRAWFGRAGADVERTSRR